MWGQRLFALFLEQLHRLCLDWYNLWTAQQGEGEGWGWDPILAHYCNGGLPLRQFSTPNSTACLNGHYGNHIRIMCSAYSTGIGYLVGWALLNITTTLLFHFISSHTPHTPPFFLAGSPRCVKHRMAHCAKSKYGIAVNLPLLLLTLFLYIKMNKGHHRFTFIFSILFHIFFFCFSFYLIVRGLTPECLQLLLIPCAMVVTGRY